MEDFMKQIREELKEYENYLENDINSFNIKLNSTRNHLFNYIDQQIEYLIRKKNEFNEEFNYLEEENKRTCEDNKLTFEKLCLTINKNNENPDFISKSFNDFKRKFSMRPTMIKSIPEYIFKEININNLIEKDNLSKSSIIDNPSFDQLFIPIDEQTSSIGNSYHNHLASQNVEKEIESESRLISNCSRTSEVDNGLSILWKLVYHCNQKPRLICFNEDENSCLISSLSNPSQFEYLSINTGQISLFNISFNEILLNIGYSTKYHQFYLTTRKTNQFIFFELNQENKQIEIKQEIKLIQEKDHFINVHLFNNFIFFLYLNSSSIVILEKYDLETSNTIQKIDFNKKLYDHDEKSTFKIIDFTVNSTFICFLILFNNKNKSKIIINDYQTINQIHSFDLIDATRPISIISTQKKSESTSTTTMSHNDDQLLLYINDPDAKLVHCCTFEQYLIPANVNNYGISSLNDGNPIIITRKDIRILDFQRFIQSND